MTLATRVSVLVGSLAVIIAAIRWWNTDPPTSLVPSVESTFIVSPLRPDGLPDYEAALEMRLGRDLARSQNAAIPLIEAVGWQVLALGTGPGDTNDTVPVNVAELADPDHGYRPVAELVPPSDPSIHPECQAQEAGPWKHDSSRCGYNAWDALTQAAARNYVTRNPAVLAALPRALARSYFYLPSVRHIPTESGRVSAVGLSWVAALLYCSGRVGLEDEDWETVTRAIVGLWQMASWFGPEYTALAVVGARTSAAALDLLTRRISLASLDDSDRTRLQAGLARQRSQVDVGAIVDTARLESLVMLSAVLDDRGEQSDGERDTTTDRNTRTKQSFAVHAIPFTNKRFNELQADLAGRPLHELLRRVDELNEERRHTPTAWARGATCALAPSRCERMVAQMIAELTHIYPASSMIAALYEQAADNVLSKMVLAIAPYREATASYPSKLNELVPDYLSTIPNDPVSNATFRYERVHDGYSLSRESDRGDAVRSGVLVQMPPT